MIDIHSHLGDILEPGGGGLIWRTGVTKKAGFDVVSLSEAGLHSGLPFGERFVYRLSLDLITKSDVIRNATATLENMQASLNRNNVDYIAVMPIEPYVGFKDLLEAHRRDGRVLPFTSVDFTEPHDVAQTLAADVAAGARGLKLHPVLQQKRADSPEMMAAVEAFAPHGLPVLIHTGVSSYYFGQEKTTRQKPQYGEIEPIRKLMAAFPQVNFIAGHSGLYDIADVLELLPGLKNVHAEISFQGVGKVRKLIKAFGPERVVLGSDWPYGNQEPAMKIARKACKGDPGLERAVTHDNAARLLGL